MDVNFLSVGFSHTAGRIKSQFTQQYNVFSLLCESYGISFIVMFFNFLLIHWIQCCHLTAFQNDFHSSFLCSVTRITTIHCKGNVSWSFTHFALMYYAINWNINFSSTDKNYFHHTIRYSRYPQPITHRLKWYVGIIACYYLFILLFSIKLHFVQKFNKNLRPLIHLFITIFFLANRIQFINSEIRR